MKGTYVYNQELLKYNEKVLKERKLETQGTIVHQKRKLAEQRELLARLKVFVHRHHILLDLPLFNKHLWHMTVEQSHEVVSLRTLPLVRTHIATSLMLWQRLAN